MNGAARPFLPGWPSSGQLDLFHDQEAGSRFMPGGGAQHGALLGFPHSHPYSTHQPMLPPHSSSTDSLHKMNEYLTHLSSPFTSSSFDGLAAHPASFAHGSYDYAAPKQGFSGHMQNALFHQKVDHDEALSRSGGFMPADLIKDVHNVMKIPLDELKQNGHDSHAALPSASTLMQGSHQVGGMFQPHGIDRFITSHVSDVSKAPETSSESMIHNGLVVSHAKTVPSHFAQSAKSEHSGQFSDSFMYTRHSVSETPGMQTTPNISSDLASPMPSTSLTSTVASTKHSVISYYSQSNEPEIPSFHGNFVPADKNNMKENAIKVAEKIIQEASSSMKGFNPPEKRPTSSSSNPYQNDRQPFQQNGMWHNITFSHMPSSKADYSIDRLSQGDKQQITVTQKHQPSSRPSSVKSVQSLDIKSPVDFRSENFSHNWTSGHQSRPASNKSGHSLDLKSPVDFGSDHLVQNWHQMHFAGNLSYQNQGQNVAVNSKQILQSQEQSNITRSEQPQSFPCTSAQSLLSQTDLPPPYEATQQKVKKPGNQSSTGGPKKSGEGSKKSSEGPKKKNSKKEPDVLDYSSIVNKPAKRGSTMIPSDNPIINNLVDEKVQQIMAAYRQKEQSSQDNLKPDVLPSKSEDKQKNLEKMQSQNDNPQKMELVSIDHNINKNLNTLTPDVSKSDQVSKPATSLSSQIMDMRHQKSLELNNQNEPSFANNPPSYQDSIMMKQNTLSNLQYTLSYHGHHSKQHTEHIAQQHNEICGSKISCEKTTHMLTLANTLIPNCCNVCEKLGQFSENCQNHKALHKTETKEKLQNVSLPSVKKEFLKQSVKQEYKQEIGHMMRQPNLLMTHSTQENCHPGIHSNESDPFAFTDDHIDKQIIWPRKKSMSNDISMKHQNYLHEKKPFGSFNGEEKMHVNNGLKPFIPKKHGVKPVWMLPYFKKTFKYHTQKLKPFKKKAVSAAPNGKVKKHSAKSISNGDAEFEANLIKNLGFPPLTKKELLTKRNIKIPGLVTKASEIKTSGHITKAPATIASSVLNTVNKAERWDAVPSAEVSLPTYAMGKTSLTKSMVNPLSFNSYSGTSSASAQSSHLVSNLKCESLKHHQPRKEGLDIGTQFQIRRSRSTEELFTHDFERFKQRSRSISPPRGVESNCGCQMLEKVMEPEKNMSDMSNLTSQIDSLRTMVTGDCNEDQLANNVVIEAPNCGCLGPNVLSQESIEGPYYTHLGAGRSVEAIRKILEARTGVTGAAIRIEKVRYTGKEGKSSQGCPIAKWIIRRSSLEEKYLAVLRHRQGHFCETAWLVIGIVAWEGVKSEQADDLYDFLCKTLPKAGYETERRCGTNDRKTCACQGADLAKRGASFSFGCSWSMYFNGCKFARSQVARKFKLKDSSVEPLLETKLQNLATQVGPLYGKCAPDAHSNQCFYSKEAHDCRLGPPEANGPFSGVTACVDFCAHAHKDIHNMNNGCTVVVTLTKHRGLSKPEDEQLHVLPLYVLEPTDERGSYEAQYEKIQRGSLEVLHHYPLEARMRSHPLTPCKKRRELARKARKLNAMGSRPSSTSSAQSTPKKQKADFSYGLLADQSGQNVLHQFGRSANPMHPHERLQPPTHAGHMQHDLIPSEHPVTYEELMSYSSHSGFSAMYDCYWEYFYANGVFPPSSILNGRIKQQKLGKGSSEDPTQSRSVVNLPNAGTIQQQQQFSEQKQREQLIDQRQQQLQIQKWQQQQQQQQHHQQQQQKQDIQKSYQQFPNHNQKQEPWPNHHQQSGSHGLSPNTPCPSSQPVQFRSQSVPLDQSTMAAKATEQTPQTASISPPTSACVQGPISDQRSWSQIPQTHLEGYGSMDSTAESTQSRSSSLLAASSSPQSSAMDLSRPSSTSNTSMSTSSSGTNSAASASSVLSRPQSSSSASSQLNLHDNTQDIVTTNGSDVGKAPLDMLSQVIAKRSIDMGFKANPGGSGTVPANQSGHPHNVSASYPTDNKMSVPQGEHPDQVKGQIQSNQYTNSSHSQGNQIMNPVERSSGNKPTLPSSNNHYNVHLNHSSNRQHHEGMTLSAHSQLNSINSTASVSSFLDQNTKESLESGPRIAQEQTKSSTQSYTGDLKKMPCNSHSEANTSLKQHVGHPNIHPAFGRAMLQTNPLHFTNSQANYTQHPYLSHPGHPQIANHSNLSTNSFANNPHLETISKDHQQSQCYGSQSISAQSKHPDNAMQINPNSQYNQSQLSAQNQPSSLHAQIIEQRQVKAIIEEQRQTSSQNYNMPTRELTRTPLNQELSSVEMQNQGRITPQNQIHPRNNIQQNSLHNFHDIPQNREGQDEPKHGYPPLVHPNASRFCFYDQFRKVENFEGTPTKPDPDVIKCEMEYNEEAFRDPDIGGVAISLSHGAVLFEVAKRELHATTGLRNPNRYHPTRISLVFYQHKNLNKERHGMYAYAKKLENMKQARIEKMRAEKGYVDMSIIENSFRGGKKRKLDHESEEVIDEETLYKRYISETAMQYRYLWDCNVKRNESFTTDSVSVKWIHPQPMVTGPYQQWI